jgi:hypothetical protein
VFGKDRLQGNTISALLGTVLISNWVAVTTPASAEVMVSMIGPTHVKPTLSLMHLKDMARPLLYQIRQHPDHRSPAQTNTFKETGGALRVLRQCKRLVVIMP